MSVGKSMSTGKPASCARQFIKDAKEGGRCMVGVVRLAFRGV